MGEMESLEAYRRRLDGSAILTTIIVTIAVPCKVWCKLKVGGLRNVGLDDVLAVITLLPAHGFFWISILGLRPGLGRHVIIDVSPEEEGEFLKYLFAGSLTYPFAIALAKFTILAFYWRLFSIRARIPIFILTFLVFIWLVSLFLLALLSCSPIRAQFDLSVTTAKCIDRSKVYLGGSLVNTIGDFVLVLMPLPYVLRLKASLGQRIVFIGIFALGIFTSIVSIIRLTITIAIPPSNPDTTYSLRDFILWSIVEIHTGLTCACLPSMRPLLRLLSPAGLFPTPRSMTKDSIPRSLEQPQKKRKGAWRSHPRNPLSVLFSNIVNSTELDSQENILLTSDHIVANTAKNITIAGTIQTSNNRETKRSQQAKDSENE
ncbi:hypothetical protein HD806DRAFT_548325 [Xylariaceae sp. AK1471]|nr:hypothetical protein HD806DRAFT_548325 [Xylariaceae sp. AK1471]